MSERFNALKAKATEILTQYKDPSLPAAQNEIGKAAVASQEAGDPFGMWEDAFSRALIEFFSKGNRATSVDVSNDEA